MDNLMIVQIAIGVMIGLVAWLGKRQFDYIDKRFDKIDERFDKIDAELKELSKRVTEVERRLSIVETVLVMWGAPMIHAPKLEVKKE